MLPEQRRSPNNGIWLCQNHAKAVDANETEFTVEVLREWKRQAQVDSWRRVLDGLVAQRPSEGGLRDRLCAAAAADLQTFRHSKRWPTDAVERSLEVDCLPEPVGTSALAAALITLEDLVLVAQPGMGKTTTLFQIAETVLGNGHGSPIVVPLGDWSVDNEPLLTAVLKRPAFREISEDDFRTVAMKPGVILLLDGWNELDSAARQRARVQIERLQLEMPGLGLLVATRKQALDVPIDGTLVSLQPLNETKQIEIAQALRGHQGERMVDRAWRTAGVRELVSIPLYLTALLALPEGAPFPTTKEEILRRFVAVHEENAQGIEVLAQAIQGLHPQFLEGLAVTATRTSSATLTEALARKSVSDTGAALVTDGQITVKPQPHTVLETLVSHHVLIRVGDSGGCSFQHHQFQEWYASHFVERAILNSVDDSAARKALEANVLNQRVWEEPLLFACERLARGNEPEQQACGVAILSAFDVDPMLAAEMIYRSSEDVWSRVGLQIQDLLERWHVQGQIDRGLRFMVTSGRHEFFNHVWPLITHEDDQVHLAALRAGKGFRPSLLGHDAPRLLAILQPSLRQNVLREIAINGGTEGLDLATTVAKTDPAPEVIGSVVDALAFRRASRHLADLLHEADERTLGLISQKNLLDEITDEAVKARLNIARDRVRSRGSRSYDGLHSLVYGVVDEDQEAELTRVIAEMEIDDKRTGAVNLIYEAKERFPHAVAEGVLRRVRDGRTLPYQASELMAGVGFEFEDEGLLNIALSMDCFDERANAAASVLGPQGVGRLIDRMFELKGLCINRQRQHDQVAYDRYRAIQDRIGSAQSGSVLAAVAARSARANGQRMADFADLILHHPDGRNGQTFDATDRTVIAGFMEDWANRLLSSPNATRGQLASVAGLACCAPLTRLLPLLKRLLDEELRADHSRQGVATTEARVSWVLRYQSAFLAIRSSKTSALMRDYLCDEQFGRSAAVVLAEHWRLANEPNPGPRWDGSPDFSRVAEKRATRKLHPDTSTPEADAIFCAIERLIDVDASHAKRAHAVSLGTVALALPHGQRDDTINTLIQMADRRQRSALLNNLVLSTGVVDVDLVRKGIADVFEAAQRAPWILTEERELRDWLRLLPFVDQPPEAFDIVQALPDEHRTPRALEQMLSAFGFASDDNAETVLFQLAEADSRLYANHAWRDAVIRLGTRSSMVRLIDLVAKGVLGADPQTDQWQLYTRLATLIDEHSDLRAYVYEILKHEPPLPGTVLLARVIAENPDECGLLLLIQREIKNERAFASPRTVESVVTRRVPIEDWDGVYNVVPVPAAELRRKLLGMTKDGGPKDAAAAYLNMIDKIRDDYGAPESEPRHPDIASGKEWPITR